MMLDADEEKSIMYMLVAETTEGSMPMLRSMGLKIAPPPRPRAPDIKPPRKAKVINLKRALGIILMSLGAMPAPSLSLSYYSRSTLRMARPESTRQ